MTFLTKLWPRYNMNSLGQHWIPFTSTWKKKCCTRLLLPLKHNIILCKLMPILNTLNLNDPINLGDSGAHSPLFNAHSKPFMGTRLHSGVFNTYSKGVPLHSIVFMGCLNHSKAFWCSIFHSGGDHTHSHTLNHIHDVSKGVHTHSKVYTCTHSHSGDVQSIHTHTM